MQHPIWMDEESNLEVLVDFNPCAILRFYSSFSPSQKSSTLSHDTDYYEPDSSMQSQPPSTTAQHWEGIDPLPPFTHFQHHHYLAASFTISNAQTYPSCHMVLPPSCPGQGPLVSW